MKNSSALPLLLTAVFALLITGCQIQSEDLTSPTPRAESKPTSVPSAAKPSTPTLPISTADFDYYVLALSWAPDYCSANPNDSQECAVERKLGFVLHGLWPQYNKGYPSNCTTEQLTAKVKVRFSGLYPNDKLFDHEWEKHGTCAGLASADYLTLTRQIKESVQIPPEYISPTAPFRSTTLQLEQAFTKANSRLNGSSLDVNCSGSGRFLSELYVCFSKGGQPAACGADVHKAALKSCSNLDFLVRSTR